MRKWKVKLPGGHVFELESDDPGRALRLDGLFWEADEVC